MQGTTLQRAGRLGLHLLTHPHYIPFYLRHAPFTGTQPLDVELPWIAYEAIRQLESKLHKNMVVFEWGSGGSTLFLARRTARVTAVESHAGWHNRIQQRLGSEQLDNVELLLRKTALDSVDAFIHSDFFRSFPEEGFDLILVDGYEEDVALRPACFYASERKIKPGGIIVVDDSWRYPELRTRNRARSISTFQSIGPCRYGVTSTDIFFY
jgi:hypothetical protein